MTQQDAPESGEIPSSWRRQAVERRLDPARLRAESRVQRFLDAAFEVMRDCASASDFTVQEVVERSGQSLRSFYQYFGGKQELLLALFEESVVSTAEHLQQQVADIADPAERLHRLVVEYYRLCQPDPRRKTTGKHRPTPAMMEFAQQMLTSHPTSAARVFAPMVAVFEEVLEQATAAGAVRVGLPMRHVASTVLEAVMFNTFSTTIAGERPSAGVDQSELLWSLFFHGIAAAPSTAAPARGRAQAGGRSSR